MQVLPEIVPLTAPYWEGAREGRLMLQHCTSCGLHWHPPEPICPGCQSAEIEWTAAAGSGTVHSFTVVTHATHVAFEGRTPYLVALVDLTEGPRVVSGIRDCPPEGVSIGMPVQVVFEDVGPVMLPQFVPSRVLGAEQVPPDVRRDQA